MSTAPDTVAPAPPKASVTSSLAWMGAAQGLAVILQFAASVVLAHYLSLHDAGIYAAAMAIVMLVSLIQALGLQALIVREVELTPDIVTTTFTINLLISLLLALAVKAISVGGSVFLGDPGVGRALSALAITPLFGIFNFLPSAKLEREGRFREIALGNTAGTILGAVATILLARAGFSYMSVPYSQWVTAGVTALVMNLLGARHVSFRLGFREWRRVADFGIQMLLVTGINTLTTRLSEILIGRFLGLSALGLYNRASSFNGLIWANVHLLISRVMLVDFADVHRSGESLRARYMTTVGNVTALLWPLFSGLAIFAGPFLLQIFGAKWVPAAPVVVLTAIGCLLHVAISMTWEVFAIRGELRVQTRIECIRAVGAISAFAIGSLISLKVAASARVIDAALAVILYRPHLNRMTDTTLADFMPIYGRSAVLTLLACAPAGVLMAAYRFAPTVPVALIAVSIVAGVLLWAGALWTTGHPLGEELRKIARRRRGGAPNQEATSG